MVSFLKEFIAKPFNSSGSVWNWALFIGLILVLIVLWSRVIRSLESFGEAVA